MKKKILIGSVFVLFILCAFTLHFNSIDQPIEDNNPAFNNTDNTTDENITKNMVVDLRNKYDNDDIIGVVRVLDTPIEEPIVQTNDNEYYLNHDIYKNKNFAGAVFLDYRVKINEGRKNLIYGHNSHTLDVPFSELEKYYEKDYFTNHQFIEVVSEKETIKYQIFSVFIETNDWTYTKLSFNDDASWLSHLNTLKSKSWYDTGVLVNENDSILILQTCSYHKDYAKYEKKYLLIIAKKV